MKMYGVMDISSRSLRKAWEVLKYAAKLNSLQKDIGKITNEAVKVKSKMKWSLQDVWRCQEYGYLPRKARDTQWSQSERETMRVTNGKIIMAGLPKPVGAHIMKVSPDTR